LIKPAKKLFLEIVEIEILHYGEDEENYKHLKVYYRDKCGIMTFDEKVIIKLWMQDNFIYAILGERNNRKYGLLTKDGEIIFPVKYDNISVNDKTIIATDDKSPSLYCIV
jgi:hypothetical protein